MSDETEQAIANEKATKAVQKEVKAQAQNLDDDGGVRPDDGKDPTSKSYGADARKAIYKKHKRQTAEEVEQFEADNPEVAEQTAAIEGRTTAEDVMPEMEVTEPDDVPETVAETIAEPESDGASPEPEPEPLPDPNALVTVRINGQERRVPQRDIDAHGGVASYQIDVASRERFAEASRMARESRERLEKAQALEDGWNARAKENAQRETPRRRRPGTDLPPQRDARRDDWSEADEMTDDQFDDWYYREIASGDPKRGRAAARAQRERIMHSIEPQETYTPTEPPDRVPEETRPESKPLVIGGREVMDDERSAIDTLMETDYKAVLENRDASNRARTMFGNLMADPLNQHRLPVDLLREAADHVMGDITPKADPRDKLVARQQAKRTMPQQPTSATSAPVAGSEDDQPTSRMGKRQSFIAEMRKRRGMPEQAPLRKQRR